MGNVSLNDAVLFCVQIVIVVMNLKLGQLFDK